MKHCVEEECQEEQGAISVSPEVWAFSRLPPGAILVAVAAFSLEKATERAEGRPGRPRVPS